MGEKSKGSEENHYKTNMKRIRIKRKCRFEESWKWK